MAQLIQLRRDTTIAWETSNPILAQGEIGLDITIKSFKIGDGVQTWNQLSYETSSLIDLTDPQDSDVIFYDADTGRFFNKQLETTDVLGIENYATTSELGGYYSKTETDTMLGGYVQTITLLDYYTSVEVNTILDDYVTTSDLNNTEQSLQQNIDNKVDQTDFGEYLAVDNERFIKLSQELYELLPPEAKL